MPSRVNWLLPFLIDKSKAYEISNALCYSPTGLFRHDMVILSDFIDPHTAIFSKDVILQSHTYWINLLGAVFSIL